MGLNMNQDMKFTTAGEMCEDLTWVLGPHGKQKHVAEWVVDKYDGNDFYDDNDLVQKWVAASKQILSDQNTKERNSLYKGRN